MRRSDKLHVLIAGGGVAALEAMVALTKLAGELVDVELVSPDTDFFYRPLSVAEPFGLGDVLRSTADACAGLRARHSLGSLVAVEAEDRRVWTSRNAFFSTPFDRDRRPAARGRAGSAHIRGKADVRLVTGLLSDLDRGLVERVVFALPGGVTWPLPLYELALLTADHLAREENTEAKLTFVTPESAPLSCWGQRRARRRPSSSATGVSTC